MHSMGMWLVVVCLPRQAPLARKPSQIASRRLELGKGGAKRLEVLGNYTKKTHCEEYLVIQRSGLAV
jgi:hypothetical protein